MAGVIVQMAAQTFETMRATPMRSSKALCSRLMPDCQNFINLDILHLKSVFKNRQRLHRCGMIAESALANRKRRFFKDIAVEASPAKQGAEIAAATAGWVLRLTRAIIYI
jgi:hypothetical protein